MAKKVILGTDIARDAFKIKVNDNFTELYDEDVALGAQINSLGADVVAHKADNVTDAHGLEYEEGVWTPVIFIISSSAPIFSVQNGTYVRIGNKVHVEAYIEISNLEGTSNNNVLLSGLPFPIKKDITRYATPLLLYDTSLPENTYSFYGVNQTTATSLRIQGQGSNTNSSAPYRLLGSNLTASTILRASFSYEI